MTTYRLLTLTLCAALTWGCSDASDGGDTNPDTGLTGDTTNSTDTTTSGDTSTAPDDSATSGDIDSEVVAGICTGATDGTVCDDDDACTLATTCEGGICGGGSALSCEATNLCQVATCDPQLGCLETPGNDGKACDVPCFAAASCQAGVCTGSGDIDSCSTEQLAAPCKTFTCGAVDGCAETGSVSDGTACGTDQICDTGACVADPCANGGCTTTLPCPTFSAGTDAPDDIRSGPLALVGGASIHVIGGSPSKQHYVYSPGSGWSTGAALEDGVREGAGALIGTKWFIVDGDNDEGVRIFDLLTGEWSLGAERPNTAARGPAGGTDGTYLFVAGGADDNLNGGATTHRYDPVNDDWARMAAMPTPRGFVAHAVVGNRLYVIGGRDRALTGNSIIDATEAYDMATNTWHSLADMPTERNSAFAAAVGDHIVVAGGFNGSVKLDVIEIYDTVNDTWETCSTSMSSAFSAGTAATLNDQLYLFGGGPDALGVEVGTFE